MLRTARNAYAALLFLMVTAAYASLWLLPRFGVSGGTGRVTLLAAVTGAAFAMTAGATPLSHVSTFVHELAHCVAAVMVGASPRKITYQPDASGLAILEFPERVGPWRKSVMLLGGYTGPGVVAGAILCGVRAGRARETLIVLSLCAAGALVLLVRNTWGAFVTGLVGVVCWAVVRVVPDTVVEVAPAFFVGVLPVLGIRDTLAQYRLRTPEGCDAAGVATELPLLTWRFVAGVQLAAAGVLACTVAGILLHGTRL
jgi:hypothetical protein